MEIKDDVIDRFEDLCREVALLEADANAIAPEDEHSSDQFARIMDHYNPDLRGLYRTRQTIFDHSRTSLVREIQWAEKDFPALRSRISERLRSELDGYYLDLENKEIKADRDVLARDAHYAMGPNEKRVQWFVAAVAGAFLHSVCSWKNVPEPVRGFLEDTFTQKASHQLDAPPKIKEECIHYPTIENN